jgi:hypothetical protein
MHSNSIRQMAKTVVKRIPDSSEAENTDVDVDQEGDVDDGHVSSEDDGLTGQDADVCAILAAEVRLQHLITCNI